jgi:hypothetical protein
MNTGNPLLDHSRWIICCHYPACVRCCPNGCRIASRLVIEQWVREGSYANARAFWAADFEPGSRESVSANKLRKTASTDVNQTNE